MPKTIRAVLQVFKSTLLELVGPDQELAQYEYGASQEMAIQPESSGEIVAVSLYSRGGQGDNVDSAGNVLIFDEDPEISAGDTNLTPAQRRMMIASLAVATTDWQTDDSTGSAQELLDRPVPFAELESLYIVWDHQDAVSLNDAAADNEELEAYLWYHKAEATA